MKKFAILLIILMFVPLVFARQVRTPDAEFTVPDSWDVHILDGGAFLATAPHFYAYVRNNAVLTKEEVKAGCTVAEYMEYRAKSLNIKMLDTGENWHIYDMPYNSVRMRHLQFFYIKEDRALTLTFRAAATAFWQFEEDFRNIEKTFMLK